MTLSNPTSKDVHEKFSFWGGELQTIFFKVRRHAIGITNFSKLNDILDMPFPLKYGPAILFLEIGNARKIRLKWNECYKYKAV